MIFFLRADMNGDTILIPESQDMDMVRVWIPGECTAKDATRALETALQGSWKRRAMGSPIQVGRDGRRILILVVISPGSDPAKQGIRISMTMDDDESSHVFHEKVDRIAAAVCSGQVETR